MGIKFPMELKGETLGLLFKKKKKVFSVIVLTKGRAGN